MAEEKMNIKKQAEEIDRQNKKFNKYREELKAKCTHTRNGELTLVRGKNSNNGELVYICKQCKKELHFNQMSEAELQEACNKIDSAIDVIKVNANPNNENDVEMLKKMAKTQYRLGEIVAYYKAATSRNNKHRGNGNNHHDNNGGGVWGKPSIQ